MTLLVLSLQVPHGVPIPELPARILAMCRAWWLLLSFLIVGYYWVGHSIVFVSILRTDRACSGLTSRSWCASSCSALRRPARVVPDSLFAVRVYGANIILIGRRQFATWSYASRYHRLTSESLDPLHQAHDDPTIAMRLSA